MGKIAIISKVGEIDLIERCLSLYHSNYDYKFLLALHSLANGWHIDKLTYYINLIEEDSD